MLISARTSAAGESLSVVVIVEGILDIDGVHVKHFNEIDLYDHQLVVAPFDDHHTSILRLGVAYNLDSGTRHMRRWCPRLGERPLTYCSRTGS